METTTQFEAAVRLGPGVAPCYLDLADAYHVAGRDEEAIAACERAVELDPGNETAAHILQELR